MADKYRVDTQFDSQDVMHVKYWDGGDDTYNEHGRRSVDVSAQLPRVDEGVTNKWPTLRGGIPFVLPGHPDIQTQNLQWLQ